MTASPTPARPADQSASPKSHTPVEKPSATNTTTSTPQQRGTPPQHTPTPPLYATSITDTPQASSPETNRSRGKKPTPSQSAHQNRPSFHKRHPRHQRCHQHARRTQRPPTGRRTPHHRQSRNNTTPPSTTRRHYTTSQPTHKHQYPTADQHTKQPTAGREALATIQTSNPPQPQRPQQQHCREAEHHRTSRQHTTTDPRTAASPPQPQCPPSTPQSNGGQLTHTPPSTPTPPPGPRADRRRRAGLVTVQGKQHNTCQPPQDGDQGSRDAAERAYYHPHAPSTLLHTAPRKRNLTVPPLLPTGRALEPTARGTTTTTSSQHFNTYWRA